VTGSKDKPVEDRGIGGHAGVELDGNGGLTAMGRIERFTSVVRKDIVASGSVWIALHDDEKVGTTWIRVVQ